MFSKILSMRYIRISSHLFILSDDHGFDALREDMHLPDKTYIYIYIFVYSYAWVVN